MKQRPITKFVVAMSDSIPSKFDLDALAELGMIKQVHTLKIIRKLWLDALAELDMTEQQAREIIFKVHQLEDMK